MKLMKRVVATLLCMVLILTGNVFVSHAENEAKVTKVEFDKLKMESGKNYVKMETGFDFSVLSDLVIYLGSNYSRSGFIEKYKGLTFSSSDETIVKLTDKDLGIFTTVGVGTAIITVSPKGKKSIDLEVEVVEAGSLDKDGSMRSTCAVISDMYKEEITESNVIDFYNRYRKLFKKYSMDIVDNQFEVPNCYLTRLLFDKLWTVLEKNKAVYTVTDPLYVSKVTNVTKSSIKVTLSRKLNNFDVVSYSCINDKKCTKSLKMEYRIPFLTGSKAAKDPYQGQYVDAAMVTLKTGTSSFTVKLPKKVKAKTKYAVVFSIDDEYGFTWTKGVYFTTK